MNLEDCRPGVIVLLGEHAGCVLGVNAGIVTVAGIPGQKPILVWPDMLTFAPRFLVNNVDGHDWQVALGPEDHLEGSVGWDANDACWYWTAYGVTEYAPVATYAAAREAVEKAVGL